MSERHGGGREYARAFASLSMPVDWTQPMLRGGNEERNYKGESRTRGGGMKQKLEGADD